MKTFFLFVALTASAAAQTLQWEQPTVAIEAVEGGGKVAGSFRFTNTGDRVVRLRSVPASCGCVVAKPEKRDYAPGESGAIPFIYSPKGRWGARAYRVFVVTDEKGIRPYQLRLEVTETRRAEAAR
ncbi:MAG: DUF1573 domain-containing protein [Chthoniobacterales bacterium]